MRIDTDFDISADRQVVVLCLQQSMENIIKRVF